jgi:hypothetical protein
VSEPLTRHRERYRVTNEGQAPEWLSGMVAHSHSWGLITAGPPWQFRGLVPRAPGLDDVPVMVVIRPSDDVFLVRFALNDDADEVLTQMLHELETP